MYSKTYSVVIPLTDREFLSSGAAFERDPLKAEKDVLERRIRDIDAIMADRLLSDVDPEAYSRRLSRRNTEKKYGCGIIPLGIWDNDLDERHADVEYEVELPSGFEGYRAFAKRNFYTWTWDGYVITPKQHELRILAENIDSSPLLTKIRQSPINIEILSDGKFGWHHERSYDCCPVRRSSLDAPLKDGYIDFKGISNECVRVATWLKAVDASLKAEKNHCTCGKCAGCIYDTISDCCGESDCSCRDCRPNRKRFTLSEGQHDCRFCDFAVCACYGCTACIEDRERNSIEVKKLVDAAMASSWFRAKPASEAPNPTLDTGLDADLDAGLAAVDDKWITVRRKRRGAK